jgi:uncharacterized membrane protein YfcA
MAVGFALGLLGGGGSILAFPVFVYILHETPTVAVPMSLPVVGLTAAIGALERWRRGQLRMARVGLFAACAMPASFVAARLGARVGDGPKVVLFAITMLTAAAALWRRASRRPGEMPEAHVRPAVEVVPAALGVGGLTGLLGVGGGFLIVPALVGVLGIPITEATGTSLAVIALNTVAAGIGYIGKVSLDWGITLEATGAGVVGMLLGTAVAPRVSARTLTRIFVGFLLVLATYMLWTRLGR